MVRPERTARFRVLRVVPIEAIKLWELLQVDVALARNVRILDIRASEGFDGPYRDRPLHDRIAPPQLIRTLTDTKHGFLVRADLTEEAERKAESLVMTTLPKMTNLVSFRWARAQPHIDLSIPGRDVFGVLSGFRALRDLHIMDTYTRFRAIFMQDASDSQVSHRKANSANS